MGTAVLTGFEAVGTVDGPKAVLSGFEVFSTGSTATVLMTDFQVYAYSLGASAVLSGFEVFAANSVVAAVLQGQQTAEPGELITLSLASSTGSPDFYSIVQKPDPTGRVPTISLSAPDGMIRSFTCPFIFPDEVNFPNDEPFVATFTGSVRLGAGAISTQDFNVTLFPHLMWRWSLGPPFVKQPVVLKIP